MAYPYSYLPWPRYALAEARAPSKWEAGQFVHLWSLTL